MSATGRGDYREAGAYYTPLSVADQIVAKWAPMFRAYPAAGRHPGRRLRILDPSAGGGAFPMALVWHGLVEPGSLEVMDLDPGARALRLPGGMVRTVATVTEDPVQTGFLVSDPQQRPDLVIGNPPFGVPRPPEPCTKCEEDGRIVVRSVHRKLLRQGFEVGDRAACPACKGTRVVTFSKAIPVAQHHIERSLEVSDRWVLLLLRLAMLESGERQQLWEGTPLRHVDVLVSRPEFMAVCTICAGTGLGCAAGARLPPCSGCDGTGRIKGQGGGDASAYGAFLWDHQYEGAPTLGWL